jgi:hypothetical protein
MSQRGLTTLHWTLTSGDLLAGIVSVKARPRQN